jgi:hypothetical protein
MRFEAIALLAASASIMFSIAGVAGEKSEQRVTVIPHVWTERPSYAPARDDSGQGSAPVLDPELSGTMGSPRMITWSTCSAPSSGSALSIYSRNEKAAQLRKGLVLTDDVIGDQCPDDDE